MVTSKTINVTLLVIVGGKVESLPLDEEIVYFDEDELTREAIKEPPFVRIEI
jgi:hypothetical protein